MSSDHFPITITVPADAAGQRLDQFLTAQIPDVSRARVQQLLREEKALVNGATPKPSFKLRGGEEVTILGDAQPAPLRAIAEDIPLDVLYEDDDLAVVNKPAGMMVHAGAGPTDDERNHGTLVNALLHRFGKLSEVGGELRPGIVHRLDKETSGLILVAKNEVAHRKLALQFSRREIKKRYTALVHGWPAKDRGTINAAISRDVVRRIRMTTRGSGGRTAVSHYDVRERIESPYGKFALVDVRIETGRTHQIRVHMASIGHPVVGDTLYGAARELKRPTAKLRGVSKRKPPTGDETPTPTGSQNAREERGISGKSGISQSSLDEKSGSPPVLSLDRNFLHAAAIEFVQPQTGKPMSFAAPLAEELVQFLQALRS